MLREVEKRELRGGEKSDRTRGEVGAGKRRGECWKKRVKGSLEESIETREEERAGRRENRILEEEEKGAGRRVRRVLGEGGAGRMGVENWEQGGRGSWEEG